MKGYTKKGIAVRNADQLYKTTREPFFKNVVEEAKSEILNEDNLGYLYKTMIETYSSAKHISDTAKLYKNTTIYPLTELGNELKTISTFINSGLNTRVYYVSLSGFDTHIAQKGQHARQLKTYADAVAVFIKDLKAKGQLDDTLIMTFSEFGRRVKQNASGGTDHGTANNVMLFGGKLKKSGFYNEAPILSDLDNGDLKYKIDFRNVYATLIDKWLGVDNSTILSKNFSTLNFI
jgi:uncharacterized protein (DUF1501 family)